MKNTNNSRSPLEILHNGCLPTSARIVALELYRLGADKNEVQVTIHTLSDSLGLAPNTITAALNSLRRNNVVTSHRPTSDGSHGRQPNAYRLTSKVS